MLYDEAEAIIINKRENEFCNDAVIFADEIAGDDKVNAALMRLLCAEGAEAIYAAACDLLVELNCIKEYYATNNIDEEVGILLTENGGRRDENNEWL
jgi:predicted metal-binding protein